MGYSARELLARLVKCEAGGEGDTGMKAVATVVMNRVNVPEGEYQRVNQGNIQNVVYQQCQFDWTKPTIGGSPNTQTIWAMNPEPIHYQIADWALSGNKLWNLNVALWFMNPFKPECPTFFPYNRSGVINSRIRKHCFFDPTPRYSTT